MGSVVSFRPRTAAVRRNRLPPGAQATIVIFPGVRYEHGIRDPGPAKRGVPLHRADEARRDVPVPRR